MKTVAITGATSGIGLATALELTRRGYAVLGVGKSPERCDRARQWILAENPDANAAFFAADLMHRREVVRVADELSAYIDGRCGGRLHALINNAGCVRGRYAVTEDGYEQQFALNHLAGFLLTHRLLEHIRAAKGLVVMTGSDSHRAARVHWKDVMLRRGYNPLTAYRQSKLCNLLFARGLNDRCAHTGIRAYVVDPGLVNTGIGNKDAGRLVGLIWSLRKRRGASPDVPAQTFAYLCDRHPKPDGLYFHLCGPKRFDKQVTRQNADRLFEMSERLCAIEYG